MRSRCSTTGGLRARRSGFAYTDFESLEIYGHPNDALREWIPRVSSGIRFTHHAVHWGGFTWLPRAETTTR